FAIDGEGTGERSFVERDAGDDGGIFLAAGGGEFVFGVLFEDVVDDLDGVDKAGGNGACAVGGLPTIEAETESADPAAAAKFFGSALDLPILHPGVVPGVKLDEVERLDANIFKALVNILEDVVRRIRVIERVFRPSGPAAVFRRNFCG